VRGAGPVMLAATFSLAGCSGHVSVHVGNADTVNTTTKAVTTSSATSTATYPPSRGLVQKKWGVHFRAPRDFRIATDRDFPDAAEIGVGQFDYVQLRRITGDAPQPVTNQNLYAQKARMDALISKAQHRKMSATGSSVAGLPALEYAAIPAPGLPRGTIARFNYFYAGRLEYRLLCVATPAHRAAVNTACDEVLATITVPEPK
jgi:hypothetical protein